MDYLLKYTPLCLYDKKDFYVSDFDSDNVIYIGYIGIYNNEHTFKFGISSRIFERDLLEQR